jgi:rubrerythrin
MSSYTIKQNMKMFVTTERKVVNSTEGRLIDLLKLEVSKNKTAYQQAKNESDKLTLKKIWKNSKKALKLIKMNKDFLKAEPKPEKKAEPKPKTLECTICLDKVVSSEAVWTTCFHPYHLECIASWIGTSNSLVCPTCKTGEVPENLNIFLTKNHVCSRHTPGRFIPL